MDYQKIEEEVKKYLYKNHIEDYCLCMMQDDGNFRVFETLTLPQLALLIKILEKRLDKTLTESLYD